MADSGRIFATERPLPVQNPSTPPSAYILAIALPIALRPLTGACGVSDVPPSSGGRVIKKIFSLSNGAVHVRDTAIHQNADFTMWATSDVPAPAKPPARRNLTAVDPPSHEW